MRPPGGAQGDLLVLDAGSMSFRGNHPVAPGITTAEGCAAACAALPGCNRCAQSLLFCEP
jgi:hypothetical protein